MLKVSFLFFFYPFLITSQIINIVTKEIQSSSFFEIGYTSSLTSTSWITIQTTKTFNKPLIFVSLPDLTSTSYTSNSPTTSPTISPTNLPTNSPTISRGSNSPTISSISSSPTIPFTNSFPYTIRINKIENINLKLSFNLKLYLINDSYCSKQWYIPQAISIPKQITWVVFEYGAYNISGNPLYLSSGPINRYTSTGLSFFCLFFYQCFFVSLLLFFSFIFF